VSGFVGLLAADGDPVDPLLLHRLTDGLAYFAPDGASARARERIGLGYAECDRSGAQSASRPSATAMPATDDHGTWVVADAAFDDRDRLVQELRPLGFRLDASAPAAQLLLAAYRAWGTRCVEHLHGDFAFAVWDEPRRRLLLARDRFGVTPLYYARAGRGLVFSNALDIVRAHPMVSSELDPAAIGDFLRMGSNTDLGTTVFTAVRCVPPAHVLVITDDGARLTRYWQLPEGADLGYSRVEQYAEHFTEVLRQAVADRLRGLKSAVLLLSGGRDSTAVAAMARAVAGRGAPALRGLTAVFDYALPDEEREYAGLAAGALDLPVEFVPQDEYRWFEDWDRPDLWRPEPVEAPLLAAEADFTALAAARGRVALTGEGGDAVLRERESHLARLLFAGHWMRAAAQSWTYVRWHHRLPRPGFRRWWARRQGLVSPHPPVPPWMRRDFVDRAGLEDRWASLASEEGAGLSPTIRRPEAYAKLRSGFWPRGFEADHPGATGIPLSTRHPFFDERVVEFLLSLPAAQWANDKGVVVAAMRGRLPDRVRLRQKTPLAGDGYEVAFAATGRRRPARDAFCEEALEFIDPEALFDVTAQMHASDAWDWTRAYSLSLWLTRRAVGRGLVRAPLPTPIDASP
jgi:asparagine synthase (glutamine-hydrolysing)